MPQSHLQAGAETASICRQSEDASTPCRRGMKWEHRERDRERERERDRERERESERERERDVTGEEILKNWA